MKIQCMPAGLLVAGLLVPGQTLAVERDSHIEQTQRNLALIQTLLHDVKEKSKPRIQNFIDDAEKLLAKAKMDCAAADTPLDRSLAAAKAMLAQGNLVAAHMLIKAN